MECWNNTGKAIKYRKKSVGDNWDWFTVHPGETCEIEQKYGQNLGLTPVEKAAEKSEYDKAKSEPAKEEGLVVEHPEEDGVVDLDLVEEEPKKKKSKKKK